MSASDSGFTTPDYEFEAKYVLSVEQRMSEINNRLANISIIASTYIADYQRAALDEIIEIAREAIKFT